MTTTAKIFWQAHRGGGAYEAPDNTMAANYYTWNLGGIPEADVRTSKDGVIVCLHDKTPARTTTVPDAAKNQPISTFTLEEIRTWDAGVKFAEKFKGEKIPVLEEAFAAMQDHPERMMYLDLKDVDLAQLGLLIDRYEVNRQIIFTHNVQDNCIRMKKFTDRVRTMLWIMGEPTLLQQAYEQARQSGFNGLDQVQIHLRMAQKTDPGEWPFQLNEAFLQYAISESAKAGIDLEIFLYSCDKAPIYLLLNQGLRWFATDEPAKFLRGVESWKQTQ